MAKSLIPEWYDPQAAQRGPRAARPLAIHHKTAGQDGGRGGT